MGHAASAAPPRHLAERAAEVPHSYPRPTEDVTPHDMSHSILATFPPQQGRPRGARRPDRAHDRSSAAPQLGKARASYCPSSAATPYGRARGQIPDVDSKFQAFGCSFIVDFTEASSCRIPAQPTKANRGRETARYVSQHPSDIAPAHGYAARSMPTRTRTGPPQRRTPRQGARILLPQQRRHNAWPSARADPRCDQQGHQTRGFRMQLH